MSLSPSSLSPPAPPLLTRHRASSTSVRPPLSLSSLATRKSFSCISAAPPSDRPLEAQNDTAAAAASQDHTKTHPQCPPPALAPPSPAPAQCPPSMLVVLVSRCLQLLPAIHGKQSLGWSTPSSPRSSTDEFVLPVSASPRKTSFGDVLGEKETSSHREWWRRTPSIHAPILFVLLLFPVSTALVLYSISTLPFAMSWPRTLSDLAEVGRQLHSYSQSGSGPMAHVVTVLAITAVWKHAWSIPGSVIWNVLAGVLFPPVFATLLLTALTTLGSLCATLLAMPLAPFLARVFPRALEMTRGALEGESAKVETSRTRSSAWVRLTVLRLIGVVPWSGINIACGVCGVALTDCFLGAFIGSLPWTAVTCQIGDILQTVASTPSPTPQTVSSLLTSPAILLKLALLSFLSLAPVLGREHLKRALSPAPDAADEERLSRWAWVQDWRLRIRLPSPPAARRREERRERERQLDILVQEKNAMP